MGGKETKVLDSVSPTGQWALGNEGIYFVSEADSRGRAEVFLYEFAASRTRKILTIDLGGSTWGHIAVSPDGRTVLYNRLDEAGSDLMLVENFR